MAKPFREEDIPQILDRETGKFKPLFGMPGKEEKNEVSVEKNVEASVEKQLAEAVKELTAIKDGIKNAFIAEFGKESAAIFNTNTVMDVVEQLIYDLQAARNNYQYTKDELKKYKDLENEIVSASTEELIKIQDRIFKVNKGHYLHGFKQIASDLENKAANAIVVDADPNVKNQLLHNPEEVSIENRKFDMNAYEEQCKDTTEQLKKTEEPLEEQVKKELKKEKSKKPASKPTVKKKKPAKKTK